MNQLGKNKRKFLFECQGVLERDRAAEVVKNFIRFIGMRPAREERIDEYPFREGGGEGYTGFFPLMESYIMVDVYTDIKHTEILISTCKPERFNPSAVMSYLEKEIGSVHFVGVL